MNNETIKKAQENMDKSIKVYQKKLASIRAGVANAALLDNVQVEYYGAPTPLTQMSSITIPEPRVLLITPYDQNSLDDIEHALLASNSLKREEKDGDITEDEQRNLEKQVQKVTDGAAKKIDQLADEKRKEITQG